MESSSLYNNTPPSSPQLSGGRLRNYAITLPFLLINKRIKSKQEKTDLVRRFAQSPPTFIKPSVVFAPLTFARF